MEKGKLVIFWLCLCSLSGIWGSIFWCYFHLPRGFPETKRSKMRWLAYFYPAAYAVHRLWRKSRFSSCNEEKINKLQKLYVGSARDQLEEIYDCQRILSILLFILLIHGMVLLSVLGENSQKMLKNTYYLARGEPGEGDRQVRLRVGSGEENKEITLQVPERKYRKEEVKAKFAEAKEYIQRHYLGENNSSEKVSQNLNLVSQISDSQIKIRWNLDGDGYVNKDGSLNNLNLKESVEVSITAILSYSEQKEKVPLQFTIYPKKRGAQEKFWEDWKREWELWKEKTAREDVLILPQEVDGKQMIYREVSQSYWLKIIILGLLFCILIPVFIDYKTEQRIIKREQELRKEYPEIVERFILLIGAGLTIRGAWFRITEDYQKRLRKGECSSNYLYEEMLMTRLEMENGHSEATAYTAFGRRLSMVQYMKFSTLLVQNLKKGSDDLLRRMDLEAADAFRERRDFARKLGEEAGTKLLLPMMLMLVIVFAMILIAAFHSL